MIRLRHALLAALLWPGLAAAQLATQDESVALTLPENRTITATLRGPVERPRRLPALLVFGGFKHAAEVLDLVPVAEPVLLASFDYPFMPPRKFIFPHSLKFLPEFRRAIRDTFAGIAELKRVLEQRADVDPARITIVGASAGAPFATIAGADQRFRGVVVVQGFGEVTRVTAHQFARKWEPKYGRAGRWLAWPLAWLAVRLAGIPDPEDAAMRYQAGQNVLMLAAAADEFIPRPASDALWAAFQKSAAHCERQEMAGSHLRGTGDAAIEGVLSRSMEWMRKNKLL